MLLLILICTMFAADRRALQRSRLRTRQPGRIRGGPCRILGRPVRGPVLRAGTRLIWRTAGDRRVLGAQTVRPGAVARVRPVREIAGTGARIPADPVQFRVQRERRDNERHQDPFGDQRWKRSRERVLQPDRAGRHQADRRVHRRRERFQRGRPEGGHRPRHPGLQAGQDTGVPS